MSASPPKRVVQEALGSVVADSLRGPELGESIVSAIDLFVFRDIETKEEVQDLFAFVDDPPMRRLLGNTFRGARWHMKIGLALARPVAHPAHAAHVRAQLVEYGTVAETSLRELLRQNGQKMLPKKFENVINKARAAGILTRDGQEAANILRDLRNRVHLFIAAEERAPVAVRDGRAAYKALGAVLNDCRAHRGLDEWHFGR